MFGTGATITYSFMSSGVNCYFSETCSSLDSFMPTGFFSEIERAFNAWSSVADLTFINVLDDGSNYNSFSSSSDIRIGGHDFTSSSTLAHAYLPSSSNLSILGDIHFNSDLIWSSVGDGLSGFDIFWVALHEIGHALGLGHETTETSVMGPYYDLTLASLQADDIAGIQYIYGAPAAVPLPAAAWLFLTSFLGLVGIRRRVSTKNNQQYQLNT